MRGRGPRCSWPTSAPTSSRSKIRARVTSAATSRRCRTARTRCTSRPSTAASARCRSTCACRGAGGRGRLRPRGPGVVGWMAETGGPDDPPLRRGVHGRLRRRVRGGARYGRRGLAGAPHRARCDCDVSPLESALAQLNYLATWTLSAGFAPSRLPGSAHQSIVPFQTFATADGFVAIAAPKPAPWPVLTQALGRGGSSCSRRLAYRARRSRTLRRRSRTTRSSPAARWSRSSIHDSGRCGTWRARCAWPRAGRGRPSGSPGTAQGRTSVPDPARARLRRGQDRVACGSPRVRATRRRLSVVAAHRSAAEQQPNVECGGRERAAAIIGDDHRFQFAVAPAPCIRTRRLATDYGDLIPSMNA